MAETIAAYVKALPKRLEILVAFSKGKLDYTFASLDVLEKIYVKKPKGSPRYLDMLAGEYVLATIVKNTSAKFVKSDSTLDAGRPAIQLGKEKIWACQLLPSRKRAKKSGRLREIAELYDIPARKRDHERFVEAIPDLLVTLEGELGIELDYTVESLEKILKAKRDARIGAAIEAYAGEILRRVKPVKWVFIADPAANGFGSSGLQIKKGFVWPVGQVLGEKKLALRILRGLIDDHLS